MKYAAEQDFQDESADVWKAIEAGSEFIVITRDGRPVAVLVPVTEQGVGEVMGAVRAVHPGVG